jgi:hypothetical protein
MRIRKRVTKDSLYVGMEIQNHNTMVVGIVRGKVADHSELAVAKEGYVSILVKQDRPKFPHKVVLWKISDLKFVKTT